MHWPRLSNDLFEWHISWRPRTRSLCVLFDLDPAGVVLLDHNHVTVRRSKRSHSNAQTTNVLDTFIDTSFSVDVGQCHRWSFGHWFCWTFSWTCCMELPWCGLIIHEPKTSRWWNCSLNLSPKSLESPTIESLLLSTLLAFLFCFFEFFFTMFWH